MTRRGRCRSVIAARRSDVDRSRRGGRCHIDRGRRHNDRSGCGDDRSCHDRSCHDRSIAAQNGKSDQGVRNDVNNSCCSVKILSATAMVMGTGTHGACHENAYCQRANDFYCFCLHKSHPFWFGFFVLFFVALYLTYTTFNECQIKILFESQKKSKKNYLIVDFIRFFLLSSGSCGLIRMPHVRHESPSGSSYDFSCVSFQRSQVFRILSWHPGYLSVRLQAVMPVD